MTPEPNPASDTAREAAVSPTPRTDAALTWLPYPELTYDAQAYAKVSDLCEQLEKEGAALRREVEELRAAYASLHSTYDATWKEYETTLQQVVELTRERDEAQRSSGHHRQMAEKNFDELNRVTADLSAALARAEAGEKRIEVLVEEWNAEHVIAAKANKRVQAANEALAEMIYEIDRACDPEGSEHPWQKGGNSLKQDEARRKARAAIDAATGGTK